MDVAVAVVLATVADVLAISGTRTIDPGLAFGKVPLLADGIHGAFAVAHGSDIATGVDVLVVVLVTDVAATLHVSCTGTTKKGKLLSIVSFIIICVHNAHLEIFQVHLLGGVKCA